jgi:hypothetical protein
MEGKSVLGPFYAGLIFNCGFNAEARRRRDGWKRHDRANKSRSGRSRAVPEWVTTPV